MKQASEKKDAIIDVLWLLVIIAATSFWCMSIGRQLSATFDEPAYLNWGLTHWRTGSIKLLMKAGTMPLPADVQTLPLYLWEKWSGKQVDVERYIDWALAWARAANLIFWAVLLIYVFRIARSVAGPWAGRIALLLVAGEPVLLGHAALATTDIAVTAMLMVFAFEYQRGQGKSWLRRIGVPGLFYGVAILAKASSLVFAPLFMIVMEIWRLRNSEAFSKTAVDFKSRFRFFWFALWDFRRDFFKVIGIGLLVTFIYCRSDWTVERTFVEWAQGAPTLPKEELTATASNANSANPASNAIDRNPQTYWVATVTAEDAHPWLKIDLGKSQPLGGYKIEWIGLPEHVYKFVVEVSDDDKTYSVMSDQRANTVPGNSDYMVSGGKTIQARYLKLTLEEGKVAVMEFRVKGPPAPGAFHHTMLWIAEHLKIFTNAGEGLMQQIKHNMRGHPTYLLGQERPRAVWYYFPVALAVKCTIPFLLLPVVILLFRRRALLNWPFLCALALFAYSITCRVQIGIRFMFPLMTLAAAGYGVAIVVAMRESQARWKQITLGVLVALGLCHSLVSGLKEGRDALCYTNEIWGGTEKGYLRLSDSNYDWGQGLKELLEWRDSNITRPIPAGEPSKDREMSGHGTNVDIIDIWYFGTDPRMNTLPLRWLPVGMAGYTQGKTLDEFFKGKCVAVGTTLLYGPYAQDSVAGQEAAAYFKSKTPAARTTTFFIYDFR